MLVNKKRKNLFWTKEKINKICLIRHRIKLKKNEGRKKMDMKDEVENSE